MNPGLRLSGLVAGLLLMADAAATMIDASTSIAPLAALANAVLGEHGSARPVIPATASPHDFALRPSHVRQLAGSDLVLWLGPGNEPQMEATIESLGPDTRVVDLANSRTDAHQWLGPARAIAMVSIISEELGRLDPAHATDYRRNGEEMITRIGALKNDISVRLADFSGRPYIVAHDAFGHFESEFGLRHALVLLPNDDAHTGVRTLVEARELAQSQDIACIITTPQTHSRAPQRLAADHGIALVTIDPLDVGAGEQAEDYLTLLQSVARGFLQCLATANPGQEPEA